MKFTQMNDEIITATIGEEDDEQCRILWLSVILQNLSDALYQSEKYPFKQRKEDAREWIEAKEGKASDFAMVCSLAGVDFQKTQERLRMFLRGELNAVDFRCLRKGHSRGEEPVSRKTYFRRRVRYERRRDAKRKEILGGISSAVSSRKSVKPSWRMVTAA